MFGPGQLLDGFPAAQAGFSTGPLLALYPEHNIYQNPQIYQIPRRQRGVVYCFRTVRDRKSSPRPHGWVYGMSGNSRPRPFGGQADRHTLCKTGRHRSCASCARGVPFVLGRCASWMQSRRTSMCSLAIYRTSCTYKLN